MAKPTSKSGQDRRRVSSRSHETKYTGRKVARAKGVRTAKGKAAVKQAKRQTGSVSRGRVERRAKQLA